MIIVPSKVNNYFEEEFDLNKPTHENLLIKMTANNNYLLDLIPTGTLMWININQIGVVVPDLSMWQECDGSEITNLNSPLRSFGITNRFTPDLRNKMLHASLTLNTNAFAGTDIVFDMNHRHAEFTGNTSPTFTPGPSIGGPLTGWFARDNHHHRMRYHTGIVTLGFPKTFDSIAYMKIV